MRESLREMISNRSRVQQVQQNLTSKIKATPADVRRYFEKLPEDSVPGCPSRSKCRSSRSLPQSPAKLLKT